MRVQCLTNEKLNGFLGYCDRYCKEHDETFLPNEKFVVDENNPTYVLVNESEEIVGAVSLILSPEFRKARKGRFRIFHSIVGGTESYKLLLDAILKHTEGIDNAYMFIPEEKEKTGKMLNELDFKVERYSYYMERHKKEYINPSFEKDFELRPFREGKDEIAWCNIINECFASLGGHVDITPEMVAEMLKEDDLIENGMMVLWNNEKPMGTVCVSRDEDEGNEFAFISCVAIMPEYRGKALGRKLIRAAVEFGRKNGLPNTSLTVNAENQNAANLYLSEGFEKIAAMVCYNLELNKN